MDVSKQRFEQEYLRIVCYGLVFHDFLQVENSGCYWTKGRIISYRLESCLRLAIGDRPTLVGRARETANDISARHSA